MEHRPLGRTGVTVSRFGLGAMVLGDWGNTDLDACHRIINAALDAGINLVDTADVYAAGQNEEIVGRAIRGRRDDVVLATKFHHPLSEGMNRSGSSRRHIVNAVDASLGRLGVDHIDIYQAHRPDPSADVDETVDALSDLVHAGKIRYWGTSTFPAARLVAVQWSSSRPGQVRPRTEQPPYSILNRGIERDVLPVCVEHGVGVLAWAPLGGGWLTGKYTRGEPAPAGSRGQTHGDHFDGANPAKFDAVEALSGVAAAAGLSLAHLAMAWAVEHPAISAALIGPRTEAQLADLLGAADVVLDADTLDAIDEIVAPGVDVNPADVGWAPPSLDSAARRRTTRP